MKRLRRLPSRIRRPTKQTVRRASARKGLVVLTIAVGSSVMTVDVIDFAVRLKYLLGLNRLKQVATSASAEVPSLSGDGDH